MQVQTPTSHTPRCQTHTLNHIRGCVWINAIQAVPASPQVAGAMLAGTHRPQPHVAGAAPRRQACVPVAGRRRQANSRPLVRGQTCLGASGRQSGGGLGVFEAAQQLLQKMFGQTEAPPTTNAASSSSSSSSSSSGNGKPAEPAAAAPTEEKSDEYTEEMQARMGTSLTYRHEDGINWNEVTPDLIVGSCLQTPDDADRLAAAGVTTVFSLQEDCDMEYFGIDVASIQERCRQVGIRHVRFPVRDFDPYDLRLKLPKAVAALAKAHNPGTGKAYIHCTAGMGRAPATALAYMFWLRGWQLPEALQALTSVRRCSPRVEAIRAATADLLTDSRPVQLTVGLRRRGTVQKAQVAGLDVGWHTLLDLVENPTTKRLEVTRQVLPGSYPFKFILDGTWCPNMEYPTYQDGDNVNNMLTVLPRDAADNGVRERLLSPAGVLLDDERRTLSSKLCPWATHAPGMHVRSGDSMDAGASGAAH